MVPVLTRFSGPSRKGFGNAQKFVTLAQEKMIGHAGDVIADDAMKRLTARGFEIVFGQARSVFHEERKESVESAHGTGALSGDGGVGVKPRMQEALQDRDVFGDSRRESRKPR